ncbi:MAG: hypothetical protein ACE5HS_23195, partial [bacterium]
VKETMVRKPKESDWKTFRNRVPEWRERYLRKKNKEIIRILTDENKTPTEQFWEAKEKMEKEAKVLVDCLDGHSRSKMHWYLFLMYCHELIEDSDLVEFSGELRENILASSKGPGL